eukprot:4526960-Pyramimonas_sp.AAC.1
MSPLARPSFGFPPPDPSLSIYVPNNAAAVMRSWFSLFSDGPCELSLFRLSAFGSVFSSGG